ncbi:MAG TPA: glycosyltransferase family 2 protein [bacterium]|nr:glycosyltransferase family 2 protein [bacterium]HPP11632.1 glycosyltransferase family 2 protein [bacterium]
MSQQEKVELSVVIPAYNEEKRLGPTLMAVADYFFSSGRNFEIIVVDDGSQDGTRQVVEKMQREVFVRYRAGRLKLLSHEKNRGKGAAVKTGMLSAVGEIVLFTDADLSTPVTEFSKMEQALMDGAEVAIASRGLADSRILLPQPWLRRQIGRIFPFLVRHLVLADFRDTQCGFKAFRKAAAQKLFQALKTDGFAFDVEILVRAKKLGMKVREVPVVWYNSEESKVTLWKSPWLMLREIMHIRRMR